MVDIGFNWTKIKYIQNWWSNQICKFSKGIKGGKNYNLAKNYRFSKFQFGFFFNFVYFNFGDLIFFNFGSFILKNP